MAHPTEKPKQLAELIRQAEASRLELTAAHARIRRSLDVPARIKASVAGSPSKWLGGSLVAGLASSLLFRTGKRKAARRAEKENKPRGFFLGLALTLLALSKPALKIYATKLLKDYLAGRIAGAGRRKPY